MTCQDRVRLRKAAGRGQLSSQPPLTASPRAACSEPPLSLNGSRLTFYFSLASNGRMIGGQPRTVWFGLHASESDRQRLFEKASNSLLANCFPVSLNREMARLIPGDVFYLQFAETERGISALLRPYGSHVSPDDLLYRGYRS